MQPNPENKVFIKRGFNTFANKTLGPHIKEKGYKTILAAGVTSYGCLAEAILGAVEFDKNLNIVVATDCTNTEDSPLAYITYLLSNHPAAKKNRYFLGKPHESGLHHATTPEIVACLNDAFQPA